MMFRRWFKHISDAAEAYKSRDGKSRRSELSTPEPDITSTSSTDLSTSGTAPSSQSATTNGDVDKTSSDGGDAQSTVDTDSGGGGDSARNSGVLDEDTASTVTADSKEKRLSQVEAEGAAPGTGRGRNALHGVFGSKINHSKLYTFFYYRGLKK